MNATSHFRYKKDKNVTAVTKVNALNSLAFHILTADLTSSSPQRSFNKQASNTFSFSSSAGNPLHVLSCWVYNTFCL